MSTFAEKIWKEAGPLRKAIIDLPFNQDLMAGTLSQNIFQFYMLQDSLYLEAYSRVLSIASAKAPDADMMLEFSQAAQVVLVVEPPFGDSNRGSGIANLCVKDGVALADQPRPL